MNKHIYSLIGELNIYLTLFAMMDCIDDFVFKAECLSSLTGPTTRRERVMCSQLGVFDLGMVFGIASVVCFTS